MSLHYIVDGYNALMRSGIFPQKQLKEARAAFTSYLEHHRPQGSNRNRMTVVFDGASGVTGSQEDQASGVVFTSGESADDKIKQMVEQSARPKDVVVVTDDRDLGIFVRRCGARVMPVCEFLNKSVISEMPVSPDKGAVNIVEREKITEELRRVWLKKK
jgi:predicted RNA-binding protein with PIN domain